MRNPSKRQLLYSAGFICSLLGAVLFLSGLFTYIKQEMFIMNATKVSGMVSELVLRVSTSASDDTALYYPKITYSTSDGKTMVFKIPFGSNPPAYKVGQQIQVLYDPSHPTQVYPNLITAIFFYTILLIIGGIISVFVGFLLLFLHHKRSKSKNRLLDEGKRLNTTFQKVIMTSDNNKSSYKLVSTYKDPHSEVEYLFESKKIPFDPSERIHNHTIYVYVDEDNYKKYWMDISFLPKTV
jgi:UPF0716 family protein affecting phage T7 exclusion